MTCAVDMALIVVRMERSELARGAVLWSVVCFGTVLLAFYVHVLADAVDAHNTARHARPRWKLLAVLATLSAVGFTHCR